MLVCTILIFYLTWLIIGITYLVFWSGDGGVYLHSCGVAYSLPMLIEVLTGRRREGLALVNVVMAVLMRATVFCPSVLSVCLVLSQAFIINQPVQ